MFEFRIIDIADGSQVIDRNLKTPYRALTPLQMVEYTEMENYLYHGDRQKEKERRRTEREQRITRNPFLKLACLCGLA